MRPGTVLVVGAGLAGTRAAETLRAEGYDGRLIVVGDEASAPYERPALSKEYLAGTKSEQQLRLRPPEFWVDSEIELMLARRVVRIDPAGRTATLSSGEVLTWDAMVLATGARPRSLPFAAPEGVHTLRTLADARALRASLVAGARLAVVGGGFIGAEVASTAVALGLDVTLIEALRVPFERTLGADVGQLLAKRYRSYGVELRLATGVVGFRAGADGRVRAARLTDGTEVPCDLALVGIGIEPARELLSHPLAGYPDLSLRRRHRQRRPLDERRRPREGRRAPYPRPPDRAAQAGLLLVGPVRPAAPTRRSDLPGRQCLRRRHRRFLRRALPRRRRTARRSPRSQPPRRRRPAQTRSSSNLHQIATLSRPRSLPRFNAWRVLADPPPRTRARWQSSPIKQSHCEDHGCRPRRNAGREQAEPAIDEEVAGRVTIATE